MKLSRKSEYAFRALVRIALCKEEVVRVADLSRVERIPCRFLEGILHDLKTVGILHSKRGVGGGCALKKAAHQITLGEVMRCFDGPIIPLVSIDGHEHGRHACDRATSCGLRQVMEDAVGALAGILDRTTPEHVCALTRQLEAAPVRVRSGD